MLCYEQQPTEAYHPFDSGPSKCDFKENSLDHVLLSAAWYTNIACLPTHSIQIMRLHVHRALLLGGSQGDYSAHLWLRLLLLNNMQPQVNDSVMITARCDRETFIGN